MTHFIPLLLCMLLMIPPTIIGVYRNCFCVEECSTGTRQCPTVSYADLLTGRIAVTPRS